MNVVLHKLFDPFVQKIKQIGSFVYSILITIPDLTLQGVLFLGFIFFILMLSISQRDPMLFQVAIICYIIFGGSFIFSYINLNGISSTRKTPRFVFAKELFVVKVSIENTKKKY